MGRVVFRSYKIVSIVVTVLLVVLVAVAASLLLYIWVVGFSARSTGSTSVTLPVVRVEAIDAYVVGNKTYVGIYARNVGEKTVSIERLESLGLSVYIYDLFDNLVAVNTSAKIVKEGNGNGVWEPDEIVVIEASFNKPLKAGKVLLLDIGAYYTIVLKAGHKTGTLLAKAPLPLSNIKKVISGQGKPSYMCKIIASPGTTILVYALALLLDDIAKASTGFTASILLRPLGSKAGIEMEAAAGISTAVETPDCENILLTKASTSLGSRVHWGLPYNDVILSGNTDYASCLITYYLYISLRRVGDTVEAIIPSYDEQLTSSIHCNPQINLYKASETVIEGHGWVKIPLSIGFSTSLVSSVKLYPPQAVEGPYMCYVDNVCRKRDLLLATWAGTERRSYKCTIDFKGVTLEVSKAATCEHMYQGVVSPEEGVTMNAHPVLLNYILLKVQEEPNTDKGAEIIIKPFEPQMKPSPTVKILLKVIKGEASITCEPAFTPPWRR